VDTKPLVGHLAAWNYSQSIKNTTNEECIQKWSASPTRRRVASSIGRVSI
jgi:urea transport system substrate-binding protein